MTHAQPLCILGGGMVGLTLAIALAQSGMAVTVIEKDSLRDQLLPEFDGRTVAIALGSRRLLENTGIWQKLEHAEPILDIRVQDAHSPVFVHYNHAEIGTEPMGHIVENRHLRQAVQQRAAELPLLTLRDNTAWQSVSFHPAYASVTFADGGELRTPLVIDAQGKYTKLRDQLGIKSIRSDYHQTAIVATIAHERPHGGLAQENFFAEGPFAVLPLRGNRSSLVWCEGDANARTILSLPQPAQEEIIQRKVGADLGRIWLEPLLFSYPLELILAQEYVKPRFALIGDAAHGMHPIAGQGVNLGFRDVAVLAEVLAEAVEWGGDFGSMHVLEGYSRKRHFDTTTLMTITDGLTRLFSNNNLAIKTARNLGLAAVQHLPLARQFFMKHAMGVSGTLPRLMQKAA